MQGPHDGIHAPVRRDARGLAPPLSLPCEDAEKRQLSAVREEALAGTESAGTSILDSQPPDGEEEMSVVKPRVCWILSG